MDPGSYVAFPWDQTSPSSHSNSSPQVFTMWDPSQFTTPLTSPLSYPLPMTLEDQQLETPAFIYPCPTCQDPATAPRTTNPRFQNYIAFLQSYSNGFFGGNEEKEETIVSREETEPETLSVDEPAVQKDDEKIKKKRRKSSGARSKSGIALTPQNHCQLCKSNRETEEVYLSHTIRDETGKVTCPILRALVCVICGASGDFAHTIKYCPQRQEPLASGTGQSGDFVPYRKVRNAVGRLHSLKF